ncbi:UbiD family decarboxylase [Ammoniphilus sp. YIM 78166]|uniref:UbiD family decarboxylase n=1 Tax=Ammoniphilus sp. YIM 78166 TaxID=1644106 RepID=UPI00106F1152|nr:UbiD family decarboxylase [Ammoniphilus sp. YIM 78166]
MAWQDLRDYLRFLQDQDDLVVVNDEVSAEYEIVALTRQTSDVQGPALLFTNVKGYSYPVLSGLFSAERRVAQAFNVEPKDFIHYYMKKEEELIEATVEDEAPCQEIVWTGDDIDLYKLPILTHYEKDGGAYVTAGLQIAKHPDTGVRNVSIHRMLLLGKDTLSVYAPPGRHLGRIIQRNEDDNRGTEIVTAIGNAPALSIASQARVPLGVDEFAVAGGLMGSSVPMVKCKTIDVEVPAFTEIVIEGVTIPHERVPDGPFGEYPGTYSPVKDAPILKVTAITMRKNPIYTNALTGMPMTENHWMMQAAVTALAYQEAYKVCPEVKAINVTPGGTIRHHIVVSIKKRHHAEARNLITALLASPIGAKYVVVVDEDIDVFNPMEVEWAINTRFQASSDLIVLPNMYSPTLDPSAPAERTSDKMGLDATAPFGKLEEFKAPYIPGSEGINLKEFIERNKNNRY